MRCQASRVQAVVSTSHVRGTSGSHVRTNYIRSHYIVSRYIFINHSRTHPSRPSDSKLHANSTYLNNLQVCPRLNFRVAQAAFPAEDAKITSNSVPPTPTLHM